MCVTICRHAEEVRLRRRTPATRATDAASGDNAQAGAAVRHAAQHCGPLRGPRRPLAAAAARGLSRPYWDRGLTRFDDGRHVVCEAVQCRACSVVELTEELEAGPVKGSALFRAALAEIGDGVRSVAEADFRLLILRSGLPRPVFNAQLFDADGIFIATVDAWWQEAGVAAEIDSRAYHLAAADQDRTTERHDRL